MDQIAYWNGQAGETWAAEQAFLDAMLQPLGDLALAALSPKPDERILDVGCGAGATSRAIAAAGAWVVGVDISRPLLEVARRTGGGPSYLEADAGAAPLPGPFDALFSRFGVMFFENSVAAFAHLRAAMKPGGRAAFVCWGPMEANAWAMAPMQAALPYLVPPEPTPPDAPGPFRFAAPGRAAEILTAAGWRNASARLWEGAYRLGDDPDAALPTFVKIGPLGRLLREQPQASERVLPAVRAVLARWAGPDGVRAPAAVWVVTASA